MELGRPGEAERFVGKALGLVKLGSSQAFAGRWKETIYQVPCVCTPQAYIWIRPESNETSSANGPNPWCWCRSRDQKNKSFGHTRVVVCPLYAHNPGSLCLFENRDATHSSVYYTASGANESVIKFQVGCEFHTLIQGPLRCTALSCPNRTHALHIRPLFFPFVL